MSKWKISFWTPGNMPEDDGKTFGCASHGFSSETVWAEPGEKAIASWEYQLEGLVYSGSYAGVLDRLRNSAAEPAAVIAVFSRSVGMEKFIEDSIGILGQVPMVGGGAALGGGQAFGEILPRAEDVALFLITDKGLAVETGNMHADTGEKVAVMLDGPRMISGIRPPGGEWQEPLAFFTERQKKRGRGGRILRP